MRTYKVIFHAITDESIKLCCIYLLRLGSFYEGPYVEEVSLDSMGCSTLTSARPSDHYGFFQTGDGRIFEGTNVDNHFNQVFK